MQPEIIIHPSSRAPREALRPGAGIDPMTLATLDIGLFRYLYKLGTVKQHLCSIFLLDEQEYHYVVGLIAPAGASPGAVAAVG